MKGKNVLVTGGAGFIGSHIVERLTGECAVTALDNLSTGKEKNLPEGAIFVKGDLRDSDMVKKTIKDADIDVIFHIGANASVPHSTEDPRYDFETNALGSFNVLEACRDSDVEKIVYASTAAVYGEPVYTPIDEGHPLHPISPYGASKLAGERCGLAFKETYGIDFAAIRIFNTYGPRQPRYVMYDFIKKLRRDPSFLEVLGTGGQIRDYCYVSDMADAFVLVAGHGNGVYNAAGGSPTSIKELAELMVSIISPEAEIRYGGRTWAGDVNTLYADITRIRELGFEPKVGFEEGVRKMIGWFEGV
ncbi:MAG TPA: NAD-dependent epimerase/dehydratase family protein [Methanosarcinales archaeon]|nr:NAD-dependent epimerase/dehydratase family protein [Methanosarcinales archaeon]